MNDNTRYVLDRLLQAIVIIVAIIALTFIWMPKGKADPYVAIGQGLFTPSIDPQYIVGVQTVDDATKPVSHIAIGYDFNNDWSVEVGYAKFETFGWKAFKPSEGQIITTINAEAFFIGGSRYFGPIFGTVGLQRWTSDAEISRSIAGQNNQHVTGTDILYAVGYDFDIAEHAGFRLSYMKFMGIGNQSLIGSKTDAGVVGLSIVIQ